MSLAGALAKVPLPLSAKSSERTFSDSAIEVNLLFLSEDK